MRTRRATRSPRTTAAARRLRAESSTAPAREQLAGDERAGGQGHAQEGKPPDSFRTARLNLLKDGNGKRARLTLDIAGEDDRRPELSDAARKRQDRCGDQSMPGHRQRDVHEHIQATGTERA